MNTKKSYETPKVKIVHLSINNAILSVCHTSPSELRAKDGPLGFGCDINPGCYSGPGGAETNQ